MKPMTDELFLASTTAPATIEGFVDALDAAGYWDDVPRSRAEKRQHVMHKVETMTEPERHSTSEIVAWIKETYPKVDALNLPPDMLNGIAQKSCAEQWHPDQVADAVGTIGEAMLLTSLGSLSKFSGFGTPKGSNH